VPIARDYVEGEPAMLDYGAALAETLPARALVFLEGDLGMGKTTLARGILRGLGFTGRVKSPTYTLIEPYVFSDKRVYHLDFYRIKDPRELEYIGLEEILDEDAVLLIEWPERAAGMLPDADVVIRIRRKDAGRIVEREARER
jgi:tRNA threonylcarbamoyladenosine biosynthesis protein TsaE